MSGTLDFYFSIGSRYSYLASTQVEALAAEFGRTVRWRPIHSRALFAAVGSDPFSGPPASRQYQPEYRSRDAKRWADLYGVPYTDPDWEHTDWFRIALALVAVSRNRDCAPFAKALYAATFGAGKATANDKELVAIAEGAGCSGAEVLRSVDAPTTAVTHERIVAEAVKAGAFGEPTMVVDGEAFCGNDRLPLVRHRLQQQKT